VRGALRRAWGPALTAALLAAAGARAQVSTPAPAPAPKPADPAPQQIEITGGRQTDTEERRRSTAAKIVIGREEIDKFGDSTLGEVLRRLPGVTTPGAPGRGGPPRLRGLGSGYTQILIDGQRVPPGFSLESLSPDEVERIEILRAPTAETGARAIAGTINIITREGFRRRINDVRFGVAAENGEFTPGLNFTRNDGDAGFTYTVNGGLFQNRRTFESGAETTNTDPATGAVTSLQREDGTTHERRRGTNLSSRLQWRLGEAGDSLSLMPSVFHAEARSERDFTREQLSGTPPFDPGYDAGHSATGSRFTNARLGATWRQRLGSSGLRLEANGNGGAWRAFSHTQRDESDGGLPGRTLLDTATTRERSANLTTKFTQLLGGAAAGDAEHSLVGGFEAETVRRIETRVSTDNGVAPDTGSDGDLEASSLRLAAYVQDEWAVSPNWAVHGGLRWEGITTRGAALDGERPTNRSSVTTPLLHAVWKPDPKGRDQVRLSLTRSYRAPALGALIGRPVVNTRAPAAGANTPTTADRAGNPDLKPELATGIDLAVERYLSGGGLISANVFHRRITNLMRSVVALETVPWSPSARYVARQQNIGGATTEGVELETKFALDQALEGAPRVELRANLSLFRSRVDTVPGPDNRLDQQAKATGNLGADYRFRGTPLTLGGNLNWVPGYETQQAADQRTGVNTKRVFDLFGLWTFSPAVALRVTASNLGPLDTETTNTISTASTIETARSFGPSYINWQVRLELKL
jgi:outer membrane receptor for ferrienterochelin and colicins